MKLTRVGVDLAKQVFQVHGVDRAERPVWCNGVLAKWGGVHIRTFATGYYRPRLCENGARAVDRVFALHFWSP